MLGVMTFSERRKSLRKFDLTEDLIAVTAMTGDKYPDQKSAMGWD